MKKFFCLVAIILILALVAAAAVAFWSYKTSAVQVTVGWYDEEVNLGYNNLDGYYTVIERASDYTAEERAQRHMSDSYEGRITHLRKETVEAIQKGELGV